MINLTATKPSQPSNNQRDADAPTTFSKPEEEPQKPTTPTEKQPRKTEAEIAILMESNGKFLQGKKNFQVERQQQHSGAPKHLFDLRILSDSSFGTPSHIYPMCS